MFVKSFNNIPLFFPCLGIILGIIIASSIETFSLYFFILHASIHSIFLAHFSSQLIKKELLYKFFQVYLFGFYGGIIFHIHQIIPEQIKKELFLANQPILTTVEDVYYTPQNKLKFKTILSLSASSAFLYSYTLTLFTYSKFLNHGDFAILRKVVIKPANDFDLKNGNLGTIFYQPKKTKITKIQQAESAWTNFLEYKRNFNNKLIQKLSDTAKSFYGLIFLGFKQKEVPLDLKDNFQKWGISHYLARSGLHLTIFSYLSLYLFMLLPISITWRFSLTALISLIYFFMTYSSISFIRSELMFLLTMLGLIFNQPINSLHFLLLTCLTVLLFSPFQLFALDFQLTFGLVFGLLLGNKLISQESKI